jgi:hypothetical protein
VTVLRDLIEVVVGLLVGGVGFLVVGGLLFVAIVSVEELAGKLRWRVCRGRGLRLERYRAEQALHGIRREAIHDMLKTARTHRYVYDDDVIEGAAVEVRE